MVKTSPVKKDDKLLQVKITYAPIFKSHTCVHTQLKKNQTINLNPAPSTNTTITESADDDFEYEVIGYRASTGERSSVVLKKNNQEFVVQEGELLDNRYTLTNVEKDKVTFTFSGQIYELENRVGQR